MVISSMSRLIRVLAVPVTAFSQIVAKDIITRAEETTRMTGMRLL